MYHWLTVLASLRYLLRRPPAYIVYYKLVCIEVGTGADEGTIMEKSSVAFPFVAPVLGDGVGQADVGKYKDG